MLGLPTIVTGRSPTATQRMHNAVMAEFGNYHADVPIESKIGCEGAACEDPELPAAMDEDAINVVEVMSQP
jgi:hypothetical protein